MKIFTTIVALLCLSAQAQAELIIEDGHARAVPPGQKISAAYMKLTNNQEKAITLVGGESSLAEKVEVHLSSMDDGVMSMRKLDGLTIEPQQSKVLKPGGLHLMIIGLNKMLSPKDNIDITLLFENEPPQTITLPVKSLLN